MLCTSERVRPCSARLSRSSSGRVTVRTPSPCSIWMGSLIVCGSVPLGPFTVTCWPSRVISTPDGTGMGRRPIRDIVGPPLVDVGEDFPTHALLVGLAVRQQAARRRDDRVLREHGVGPDDKVALL